MRIVHCFRSPVGGIFRHVRDLVAAQAAEGHEIGIVCDSTTGGPFEEELFEALKPKLALGLKRIPMQRHVGLGDVGAAWATYRAIKELRPEILHGHGAKGGVYARVFGSLLRVNRSRVPRLYSPHGGSLHYDPATFTGKAYFTVERMLESVTDQILFVAAYESQVYESKIGRPRCPARVVHNGLNLQEFDPVEPNADAADFLYVGMMRDLKGPDLFIEALAQASAATGKALTAAMVGDGDQKREYQALAARLGLSSRIAFYGAMPARTAFALGRIMIVPSRAEAMPYIVLEALAAGRPLIATAVGGIPEILGRDSPALAQPDAGDLARLMTAAIRDPDALEAAMPHHEILLERFSARAMARAISSAYQDAAAPLVNGRPD